MSSPLLTAAACLFAALNVSAASAQDIVLRRSTVTISEGNDGPRIDVKADRVSFKSLMAKVAAKSGRTVEGGELISRDPELTSAKRSSSSPALSVFAPRSGARPWSSPRTSAPTRPARRSTPAPSPGTCGP